MKYIALIVIFSMAYANSIAQTKLDLCNEYIDYTHDKVRDFTYISTKKIWCYDAESEIILEFIIYGENTLLNVTTTGPNNCIPQHNKIYILFTDQTRLEITTITTSNCKGSTIAIFGEQYNNLGQIDVFMNKKIETIRIITEGVFIQHDLTPLQSEKLMYSVRCLMKIQR